MTPEQKKWLESYSFGGIDRRGRPLKNRDVERILSDMEYRRVAEDIFEIDGEKIRVSTVFLVIPHYCSITSDEKVYYETMIFGGKFDHWQRRWRTAGIASKAHHKIVQDLKDNNDLEFEDTNIITTFLKLLEDIKNQENEGEEWKNPE